MAPQFTKTNLSLSKDNPAGLDSVAVIQAWAASYLEDRIDARTTPALIEPRYQESIQHLLLMEEINQVKRITGLLWGGKGGYFSYYLIGNSHRVILDSSRLLA